MPEDEKILYKVAEEGGRKVLKIDYSKSIYPPNIDSSPISMANLINKLIEVGKVNEVSFLQKEEYIYDENQVNMLWQIADLLNELVKVKNILDFKYLRAGNCEKPHPERRDFIRAIIMYELREDPIGAFIDISKKIADLERSPDIADIDGCQGVFIQTLQYIHQKLASTSLIKFVSPYLKDYSPENRDIYGRIFRPMVTPSFLYTRVATAYPSGAEELENYKVGETDVMILKLKNEIRPLYHIKPPEFKLSESKYDILGEAKQIVAEHKPQKSEFLDPKRTRQVFMSVERDLIQELSKSKGVNLAYKDVEILANILVRHTIGFGLLEVILADQKIQDVSINAPIGKNPISVIHQDYGECLTNVSITPQEADSWATKLRLISGRPLDEANPVMDANLILPHANARVAAIQEQLSPSGLAFAIRRHRDKPWTLPLFIKNKMIDELTAGLLSFIVDGSRTVLIAGTRSSGKTSLLGALMIEIMRRTRIITIEDTLELPISQLKDLNYDIQSMKVRAVVGPTKSGIEAAEGIRISLRMGDSALIVGEVRSSVRGNEEVFVVEDGVTKRIPIKEVESKDHSKLKVPTLGFDMKMKLAPLKKFVKHPKRKKLIEVVTKTGRRVTVTHDHSLFTSTGDFKVAPIKCSELKQGDTVIIPSSMPAGYNNIKYLDATEIIPDSRLENAEGYIREAIKKLGWKKATETCGINCGDIYNYLRRNQKTRIPIPLFKRLMKEAGVSYDLGNLRIKHGTSNSIPARIPVDEDFCRFLGYYVAEGYYNLKQGGKVVITNSNEIIVKDLLSLSQKLFGVAPRIREFRSLGKTVQIHIQSAPLAMLFSKLECGRVAKEKRVPALVYGLSKRKIAAFLKGAYSGDGSFTASKSSGNSVRYFSTSKKLVEDVAYLLLTKGIIGRIHKRTQTNKLGKSDLWTVEFKQRDAVKTFLKEIGFVHKKPKLIERAWSHSNDNTVKFSKEELTKNLKYPRKYRHLKRFERCSKFYLKKVVSDTSCKPTQRLRDFANGEFYLDSVKEINEVDLPNGEFVYDLSVNPSQNFVGGFGGIILHNTEALALYEAMRVGALANVVAGTIHGDSPYGVYDRVVNDLGVPPTSFKATDLIVVANPVKSAAGLKRERRVVQVSEVRKDWTKDPAQEGGFVDLMVYNPKTDSLEPTPALIEGESEVLKSIAGRVRAWAGDWDAVWQNIQLRAKVKKAIVDISDELERPELLEADWVVRSNDEFHIISQRVEEKTGKVDSDRIYAEWEQWFRLEINRLNTTDEKKKVERK